MGALNITHFESPIGKLTVYFTEKRNNSSFLSREDNSNI